MLPNPTDFDLLLGRKDVEMASQSIEQSQFYAAALSCYPSRSSWYLLVRWAGLISRPSRACIQASIMGNLCRVNQWTRAAWKPYLETDRCRQIGRTSWADTTCWSMRLHSYLTVGSSERNKFSHNDQGLKEETMASVIARLPCSG